MSVKMNYNADIDGMINSLPSSMDKSKAVAGMSKSFGSKTSSKSHPISSGVNMHGLPDIDDGLSQEAKDIIDEFAVSVWGKNKKIKG